MLRITEPNLTILNKLYEKYYDDHTATWDLSKRNIEEKNAQLLDEKLIIDLCQFLDYYRGIRHLDLSNNHYMGKKGVAALADNITLLSLNLNFTIGHTIPDIISKNNTLKSLMLSGNALSEDHIAKLVTMQNLTSLDLTNNNFQNFNNLLSILATFPKLTSLKFFCGTADITTGIIALAERNQLTSLEMNTCILPSQNSCDEVANILASMPLTSLSWCNSQITLKGVSALAKSETLQVLHLFNNQLDANCAIELAKNTKITDLDISSNNIGAKGAKAITKNTYIKKLDISCNDIGDQGIEEISKMTSLLDLKAVWINITDIGLGFISQCKSLIKLQLDDVKFSDKAVTQLIRNLCELNVLSLLHEHGDTKLMQLTDAITHVLATHPTISELNISGHLITTKGLSNLCKMSNLKELYLPCCPIESDALTIILSNHSLIKLKLGLDSDQPTISNSIKERIKNHIQENALQHKKQYSLKTKHLRDFLRLSELTGQLHRQSSKVFSDQQKKDAMCAILSNEVAKQITHFDQGHHFLLFGKTKQENLSNMAQISKLCERHPAERNNKIVDVIKNIKPR